MEKDSKQIKESKFSRRVQESNEIFSGPYFPAFGLETEIYPVNFRIQSKYEKIKTTKSPYSDSFHAWEIY